MDKAIKLKDLGEKEIIRSIIKPLFNPNDEFGLVGDDCAVIDVTKSKFICLSTDRVPADLISFKLGLINYYELGRYLAILNISDVVANGSRPVGLLLNLALDNEFLLENFKNIISGASDACHEYHCRVLGGDLSNSAEMSISATSVGVVKDGAILFRKGASVDDLIYCSDYLGLTSTAFYYFLKAKPKGFSLPQNDEELLVNQFKKPKVKLQLSQELSRSNYRITCMDNTDGVAQTFYELSEINSLQFELKKELLPIHEVSYKVADFLKINILDVVLGGGADFQLLGTIQGSLNVNQIDNEFSNKLIIIGKTCKGLGVWIKDEIIGSNEYKVSGWDYFSQTNST